jgi:hypothetical protein
MDALQTRAHHHIEEVLPTSGSYLIKQWAYAPTRLAYLFVHIWFTGFICYVDDELYYDSDWPGILVENQVLVTLKICQHLCYYHV